MNFDYLPLNFPYFDETLGLPITGGIPLPTQIPTPINLTTQQAIAEAAESSKRKEAGTNSTSLAKRVKYSQFSDEQIQKMQEGRAAHKTAKVIAKEIGDLTAKQVANWLSRNPSANDGERKVNPSKHKFTQEEDQIILEGRRLDPPDSYVLIAARITEQLGIVVTKDQVKPRWNKYLAPKKVPYQKIRFKFTEEQDREIARLINEGKSFKEISVLLQPTLEQKNEGLEKIIPIQINSRWANGLADSYPGIKYRYAHNAFSEEEDREILARKFNFEDDKAIALDLNRRSQQINDRYRLLCARFRKNRELQG